MSNNPKSKRIQPGSVVAVWQDSYGFASGTEYEVGLGVIVSSHEGYTDTMRNKKELIYEIKLHNGQTVHGCHNHFYNQSYYFMTKEEYNDLLTRQVAGLQEQIEKLQRQKDDLLKKCIP